MDKKHIILVTTWFPPANAVAVNRMVAFAKYLDHSAFDIDVVTLKREGTPFAMEGVRVHYLENRMLFRKATFQKPVPFLLHKAKALYNRVLFLFQKNEFKGWQKEAIDKVRALLAEYGEATTVISSFEPIAAHLVPLHLKREGLAFHWVADCRDEIAQNPSAAGSLKAFYCQTEKEMLAHADAVTTVSKPILDDFRRNCTNPGMLFAEIRNGYDFEICRTTAFNEVFTLSSLGTFYGKRKPHTFFAALERFVHKHPDAKLRVRLVGVGNSVQIPMALRSHVEATGKVLHEEAVSCMQSADALLLILPKLPQKGVYSGKLFEYLACRRPIVAVVDKADVAAQLIEECRAGFVADFDDVAEIEAAIESAYLAWLERRILPFHDELIGKHHRKVQVGLLNQLIINSFCK